MGPDWLMARCQVVGPRWDGNYDLYASYTKFPMKSHKPTHAKCVPAHHKYGGPAALHSGRSTLPGQISRDARSAPNAMAAFKQQEPATASQMSLTPAIGGRRTVSSTNFEICTQTRIDLSLTTCGCAAGTNNTDALPPHSDESPHRPASMWSSWTPAHVCPKPSFCHARSDALLALSPAPEAGL
jgi:hypothetical protein